MLALIGAIVTLVARKYIKQIAHERVEDEGKNGLDYKFMILIDGLEFGLVDELLDFLVPLIHYN